MSRIVKKVKNKLDSYGIKIYNNYKIEGETEHVFYAEEMILFVDPIKETIGLSLQATIRPDKAASMALILSETNCEINVMEPFIFNNNNEFVSGDKAFELIDQTKHKKMAEEVAKQHYYVEILEKAECFEC
jgi:hypothetical protein